MQGRIHRYKRPDNDTLKRELAPERYHIMVENGTEYPFSNKYWDFGGEGVYVEAITGEPLFSSRDKLVSS